MQYLNFTFRGKPEWLAVLSVYLFEDGFEGIEDDGKQIHAFIQYPPDGFKLSNEVTEFIHMHRIDYDLETINDTNWNEKWESSFEPINVNNECLIRAEHHTKNDAIKYDIVIQPKMTFGTGHHPTTYLMVEKMLALDVKEKSVFDFGTGTGVLAILAEKMGASNVFTNDIDQNCAMNTNENILLNNCSKVEFKLGDIDVIENNRFDIILANVTRNTILERFKQLYDALNVNGYILLSGFYNTDLSYFQKTAADFNLSVVAVEEKDEWLVVVLKK